MNKQTKYSLVFLAIVFFWSSSTCESIVQAAAPIPEPTWLPAAKLLSPAGGIGSLNKPTYTWIKVPGASRYLLWVKGPSGIVFRKWYQAASVCRDRICSVTPPYILSSGNHTWRIRTRNNAGYGPWSTSLVFTISNGTSFYSCVENSRYQTGDYLVFNNQWNRDLLGPNDIYHQCMQVNSTKNPFNVEWGWSWPYIDGYVKAFPEIIYGWAPWLHSSTTSYLPVQLSVMSQTLSFKVDFDTYVWTDSTAIYNLAFDMFITSSPIPTPETRTHEVMIWVNDQNPWISTDSPFYIGRPSINEEKYDVWIHPSSQIIIVFRKVQPALKGSIVINHFLDYLLNNGYLPSDGYLADIEFGNEIIAGSGRTFIHNYSITPLEH